MFKLFIYVDLSTKLIMHLSYLLNLYSAIRVDTMACWYDQIPCTSMFEGSTPQGRGFLINLNY